MSKLRSIAPCFAVQDPGATAQWYRDRLGFEWAEVYGPAPHHNFFAIVGRGELRIILRFTRDGPGERPWVPDADQPQFDAYLDTDDVDALRQVDIALRRGPQAALLQVSWRVQKANHRHP